VPVEHEVDLLACEVVDQLVQERDARLGVESVLEDREVQFPGARLAVGFVAARQEPIDLDETPKSAAAASSVMPSRNTAAITRLRSSSCCAGESGRMSTRRSSTTTTQRPRNHRVTGQ
jgi:hypothetical protein